MINSKIYKIVLHQLVREKLSSHLHDAFSHLKVSFTTEMWNDTHHQVSYITTTAQLGLLSQVVHVACTEEFNATTKKTGINIRAAMSSVFSSLDI